MSAAEMLAGAAPERTPDWHSIDWRKVWRTVRRLQARIVKAVAEGRWNKVKALVYLLTHSFSGRALAILRVVSNSGAKTPGVDGILWNTPEAKSAAFSTLRRHGYQPQPLRRVYIPKSNGKRRGLGIPTMTDRAMQALYLLGLDPIAESQADGHSYGFRLERRCADALAQTHILLSHRHGPEWILEGDIKACFDRISHEWLLTHVPMDRQVLAAMVESGFPGEARLVRHHGRNTSRRDHFTRPGELDPGWTATAAGGTLRQARRKDKGSPKSTWSAMRMTS